MRPPDAQRVCQYHSHTEKTAFCNVPLTGRGRHRWCALHAIVVRQEQRRARGAVDVRHWRSQNIDINRLREFIRRQAERLVDAGYPRAAIMRRLQKSFGDTACGPDNRRFAHTILENGFHAYVVFEVDPDNLITLFAEAYCDTKLPAPPDCMELVHESPLKLWVRDRFNSFNLCPGCRKPFWWNGRGDAVVSLEFPHPPDHKEHQPRRGSQSAPFPSDHHPNEKNPGRRVWRAIVQARMPQKSERRAVPPKLNLDSVGLKVLNWRPSSSRKRRLEAMRRDPAPQGN